MYGIGCSYAWHSKLSYTTLDTQTCSTFRCTFYPVLFQETISVLSRYKKKIFIISRCNSGTILVVILPQFIRVSSNLFSYVNSEARYAEQRISVTFLSQGHCNRWKDRHEKMCLFYVSLPFGECIVKVFTKPEVKATSLN